MPATQRGIYHNLKESNYVVSNTEATFFFSSKLYRDNFIDRYEEHRKEFLDKLARLMLINPLNMNTFADITLYMYLEKRGFRVWIKEVDIKCEELYQYGLRKATNKNTLDWFVIQKPKLIERLTNMG